jgi:hypothetical protein
MKKFLISALALATLATSTDAIRLFGILFDNDNVGLILGSDKDEWGCIPSAGYTWCNDTQSCLPINQVCSNYSSTL